MKKGLLAVLLLLAGGCGDGVGPETTGSSIKILNEGKPYDEQTFALGSNIQLTASVFDAAGNVIDGQVAEWSSDRSDIASLDVTSGGSVVVTARAVGTAYIVARHDVGEDTARVNVAIPVQQAGQLPGCAGAPTLNLTPGATRLLSGEEALPICLPSGSGSSAEYALIVMNSGTTATSTLQVQAHSAGTMQATAPPTPQIRALPTSPRISSDSRFHSRLREEVSARLEPLLRAGVPEIQVASPRPQVSTGQLMTFNVETLSVDGCTNPVFRTGRVKWVSQHAIVVADTLNPNSGYTDAEYGQFADFFDQHAWPLDTENFGVPSDADGNGKIIIFFTSAVNALPQNVPNGNSYVGGFFFNRDLFPKTSCAGSNAGEMFYMLVPNPSPRPGERAFSKDFVSRGARTVLVHEFQHLINDSRRLHINRSPVWEESWLNEGLSHIAEELMFYRDSGLNPGGNLGPSAFTNAQARESFRLFQIDNMDRYRLFLAGPEYSSLMGSDDLTTRGGAWAFLRYAADRRGGSETTLWRSLVHEARTAGLGNLRQALGVEPMEWIRDWTAAVYLDDTTLDTDERFSIRSWNFRALFPVAGTLWSGIPNSPYPLKVSQLFGFPIALPLQGGAAGCLRAAVSPGAVGTIRVVVGNGQSLLPAPSRLKVLVVRTK
jgi:hypothetical protein